MKAKFTINTSALQELNQDPPFFGLSTNGDPDDVYLLLDQHGNACFDTRSHNMGTPVDEWNRLTLRWEVPATVRSSALDADFIPELLQRVHDGHSIEWDGNNYVGVLDEDAEDASNELERRLEQMEVWDVCSADGWMPPDVVIAEMWSQGKSIEDVASDIMSDAMCEGFLIAGGSDGIAEVLCAELLRQLENDDSFDLTTEQREALLDYDAVALAEIEAARTTDSVEKLGGR